MSPAQRPPRPTVQLLHVLPDGSSHVDWMIAQDPRGREPLVTFRLPRRLEEVETGRPLEAIRIEDHRPLYLSYEGPIRGRRGTVRRLAAGAVVRDRRSPDSWELEVSWDRGPRQRLTLRGAGAEKWVITADIAPAGGEAARPGEWADPGRGGGDAGRGVGF